MRMLFATALSLSVMMLLSPASATTVATISGCYDCGVFDTPSLIFNNTTGGTLTNAQMVLKGYQGDNNGLTQTINLGTLSGGSTQFFWGYLPGTTFQTTPGYLASYDYDDMYIGTSKIINDPTCGGSCVSGGGPQWYAQVGNFGVTFTATVSGGTFDGKSVFSVFSPNSNATGGFVGWEGLDPNGFSENPLYDVHNGSITGDLANIDLGVPPAPEPSTWAMMIIGFLGLGFMAYRRNNSAPRFA